MAFTEWCTRQTPPPVIRHPSHTRPHTEARVRTKRSEASLLPYALNTTLTKAARTAAHTHTDTDTHKTARDRLDRWGDRRTYIVRGDGGGTQRCWLIPPVPPHARTTLTLTHVHIHIHTPARLLACLKVEPVLSVNKLTYVTLVITRRQTGVCMCVCICCRKGHKWDGRGRTVPRQVSQTDGQPASP